MRSSSKTKCSSSQEPGDLTGARTWSTWSAGAVISRTHPGPRGAAPFCYRRRVGSGQQIQEQYFKWTVLKRERIIFQTSADGLLLPLHTLYLCRKLNVLTSGRACEEREREVVCAARISVYIVRCGLSA